MEGIKSIAELVIFIIALIVFLFFFFAALRIFSIDNTLREILKILKENKKPMP